MRFRGALSLLALLAVAGCGGAETKTVTVRETVTETGTSSVPNEAPAVLKIYLLQQGKVAPVSRTVVTAPAVARAALEALLAGPEDEDLETAIPPETELKSVTIDGGVATVDLSPRVAGDAGRAQLVYTLTQFPTVKRVDFGAGAPVGRKAFEAQTPAILVESPLPGESVEPGFQAKGTANTFEATFNYELKDASGKLLRKAFVTATSGSGTRGTFAFTVPYEVDKPQEGKLLVFEVSAEDGSRIHESELPLQLE